MAADEGFRQAELAAERAHLVLEQFAQRLDQLHVHALGQAADIVMRLDRHRRAAGERDALDHVGIERALGQKVGAPRPSAAIFFASASNTSMNSLPMVLRFCFGVGRRRRARRGTVSLRVDMDERDVVVVAEQRHHLLAPRRAAAGRDRRRRRSAGRRSPRGSAPRRPRNRRRRRGRRSPARCRPGRGSSAIASARKARHGPVAVAAGDLVHEIARAAAAPSGVCTTSGWNCTP